MTIVLLLILAVLWAAVLIPPAVRARVESSPADSIGTFHRQLSVLQRTAPGAVTRMAMASPVVTRPVHELTRAQKRRRDVLSTLLAAMLGTFVLGMVPSLRMMWRINFVLDLLFAVYVGLLIRMRTTALERETKVHYLPSPAPEPALLLRRTGN